MRGELALAGAEGDVGQRLRVAQVLGRREERRVVVVPLQAVVLRRGGRHDSAQHHTIDFLSSSGCKQILHPRFQYSSLEPKSRGRTLV